jgi:hypothetical protein
MDTKELLMSNGVEPLEIHSPAFARLNFWKEMSKAESYEMTLTEKEKFLRAMNELTKPPYGAATPEPAPKANNHPAIADVVAAEFVGRGSDPAIAEDIMARKAFGLQKYKTPLQPFNGRDTLNDLYQEVLDAVKYARVVLYEAQVSHKRDNDEAGLYEELMSIVESVHYLKEKAKRNGDNAGTSGQVGRDRQTQES